MMPVAARIAPVSHADAAMPAIARMKCRITAIVCMEGSQRLLMLPLERLHLLRLLARECPLFHHVVPRSRLLFLHALLLEPLQLGVMAVLERPLLFCMSALHPRPIAWARLFVIFV
jgi:hypothetical protein